MEAYQYGDCLKVAALDPSSIIHHPSSSDFSSDRPIQLLPMFTPTYLELRRIFFPFEVISLPLIHGYAAADSAAASVVREAL
mmetsp:Transcript_18384/g.38583  ORF Transcript_18384/g.38583 Transcript_18384/m.38583 type:complete len:82 (-) Transcript_18384:359-604(-)